MFNPNRDGLDRHLDNAGSTKVVMDRTPAISGLIGSGLNFLVVVGRRASGEIASWQPMKVASKLKFSGG